MLDALSLSDELRNFSQLETIYLDNVSISGDFTRVYLPNLKSFVLNQFIDMKSEKLETYQEIGKLHSTIFFDKVDGKSWDMNTICNLGVDVVVTLNGFKLIQINRSISEGKGEIELYVPYCNQILQSTEGIYQSLSLGGCNISKSSIPNNLNYLNLFDVTVSDGNTTEILQTLTQLEELCADLPGKTLDLSVLPNSIKFLSLSSAMLVNSQNTVLNNVQELSLGFCNVSSDIYDNFTKIFPSLQRLAAFGFQSANYKLLNALDSKTIAWLLLEEFDRNATTVEEKELDAELVNLGIPVSSNNFLIKRPKYSNTLVGVPLPSAQNREQTNRYSLLGWDKFLTFQAYLTADKHEIKT